MPIDRKLIPLPEDNILDIWGAVHVYVDELWSVPKSSRPGCHPTERQEPKRVRVCRCTVSNRTHRHRLSRDIELGA